MTHSIGTLMQDSQHRAFKVIAYGLGLIIYLGGIVYAEARAYSLFTKTIDAELLPIALIGIIALGLTAIAAPLAHHFGTAPGVQRIFLDVFYAFDIFAMGANAVLDAALHDSGQLTSVLSFWKMYLLPSLPLLCLLGWAVFFMLDPSHRKRDMVKAARAATEEVLTTRIIEQMKSTNLTDIVDDAARSAAGEIVAQTLGTTASTRKELPPSPTPESLPTTQDIAKKFSRNGRKPELMESGDPNV